MKKRLSTKRRNTQFEKIIKDIKNVKVQGATNVAKQGIKAYLLKPEKQSAKKILSTRPTEPLLQNAIKLLEKQKSPAKKKTFAKKYLSYIKKSKKSIAKKGAKIVKNDMNIFSHCHSSTVIEILKQAKKQKKKFVVYTTEVEPLLQGRQTARDLAKARIKVVIFPDLAMEQALNKCDLVLFGVDAFTKSGVANKIGTATLCKLAKHKNIPRYSCGASLKLTRKLKLEKRKGREVWDERNRKIKVINPAFDFTKKKLITGVISEFGVLSFNQFIKKAKQYLKKFIP